MAKAAIRNLLAQTSRAAGYLRSMERESKAQLNVLCYHRILPSAEKAAYFSPDLVVTPETFRKHCETLAEHYCVAPVSEAMALFESGNAEKPIVAMSFDDGYVDNLLFAAPILKEFGLRATFYVVSGLVGSTTPPWYDLLARCVQELNKKGEELNCVQVVEDAKSLPPQERKDLVADYCARLESTPSFAEQDLVMNAEQLQELCSDGHEIGSHSISHEILPLLDDEALEREVRHSKHQLENTLERAVTSFCYPNGDYDARTITAVKASGYENAVSVAVGSNESLRERYALKRRYIHEERLAGLSGKASSTVLRAEICGLNDRLLRRKPYSKASGRLSQKRNILTIAVEDYFQATALKPLVKEKQWGYLESRVADNTRRTLDFLDQFGHTATFFVLGRIADEMPELVQEIVERGHEVASKGYEPQDLHEMSRNAFRTDALKTRTALENATGLQVMGHRKPDARFSAKTLIHGTRFKREGFRFLLDWPRKRIAWERERRRQSRSPEQRDLAPAEFRSEMIQDGFLEALNHYELRPYFGQMTLFRPPLDTTYLLPGGVIADCYREIQDSNNHWTPFAKGGIHCIEVTGDHDSMVLEPHVRVLGDKVCQVLSDAQDAIAQLKP